MTLLNKISRYYIINSALLLLVAFVALYFALNFILEEEIDEKLSATLEETVNRFKLGYEVNDPPYVEIIGVTTRLSDKIEYSDTSIFLKGENELDASRQAVKYFKVKDNYFKITVRTSLIEKEDLVVSLLITFLLVFLSLMILLYFVNRKTTKEVFSPFYKNLENLKLFSVKSGKSLNLQDTNIKEFAELNNVLIELSNKAKEEYNLLKEFTEDLSHELQTPVAIIKNQLDLVLQKDINDQDIIERIGKSYQNINRLDKLNRSLILLSKLENLDNYDSLNFQVNDIIERMISNYSEAAAIKNINIKSRIDDCGEIECNETLFEILIGNLFSNAIKHNYDEGNIEIEFKDRLLTIKNTGNNAALNPNEVFQRFNKNSKSSGSIGLGLAVTKKIADKFNFNLYYAYENSMHCFSLKMVK